MRSKHLFFIIILITFLGAYRINRHIEQSFHSNTSEVHLLYLPSGKFLKGAALAYDEIFADLMFIKTLGYFGSHAKTDRNYTWLAHMLEVVTTLDPLYQFPYEFGGVILSTEAHDVEGSIAILKKGMINVSKEHPRYWYFPFYCAFQYMYFHKDYETAANYLEQAMTFEQSPPYLPLLVARLRANAQSPEAALPFLQEMIKTTDDDSIKKHLIRRIQEINVQSHLNFLSKAVEIYRSIFNDTPPKKLDDLVIYGIISAIPEHPMGGGYYYYADDTHEVKSSIEIDLMKVYTEKKHRQNRHKEETVGDLIHRLIYN